MPSQNRLPLTLALSDHDQRDAATLVAAQLTDSVTASADFPDNKDTALVDATSGAVNMALPVGNDEIIGLPFVVFKTDVSANAAGLACSGSDTFADATTSITTAVQGASIGAMWDGLVWRQLAGPVTAGAVSATSFSASGAITAGTTLAAGTAATIGGTGSGTAAANLNLNKTASGTSAVVYKEANAIRAKAGLDASENFVIEVFTGAAGSEASGGSITIAPTGAITITIASVRSAADDTAAAALSPAVPVGGLYRTGSAVKIRVT